MKKSTLLKSLSFAAVLLVSSCADVSYVQKESPANPYKDYRTKNMHHSAVIGVGEPISKRQMKANALFSMKGKRTLEGVLHQMANTYNVAVRWGDGVRKGRHENVLISDLSFDEARRTGDARKDERNMDMSQPEENENQTTHELGEMLPGVNNFFNKVLKSTRGAKAPKNSSKTKKKSSKTQATANGNNREPMPTLP